MSGHPAWLAGARGAPSAHNTQPWRFTPAAGGRVIVRWDRDRTLPAGDPTNRDLYLALGAAIEGARLRSGLEGRALVFTPADGGEAHTVGSLVPSARDPDPADLLLARWLDARHTARTPHLRQAVPPAVRASLEAEAERAGRTLRIVEERAAVRQLATLARRATAAQFADRAVHAELWRWLRLDPGDPDYRRDGLTAACLNLSGLALAAARLTLPPARMRWIVRLGGHHLLAMDTERTVRRSASICLLTAPSSGRSDRVESGRLLMRLWLLAAVAGLSSHPLSAVLDCATTVGPAMELFRARGTPVALFRLGACPPVARAPRLPADELIDAADTTT